MHYVEHNLCVVPHKQTFLAKRWPQSGKLFKCTKNTAYLFLPWVRFMFIKALYKTLLHRHLGSLCFSICTVYPTSYLSEHIRNKLRVQTGQCCNNLTKIYTYIHFCTFTLIVLWFLSTKQEQVRPRMQNLAADTSFRTDLILLHECQAVQLFPRSTSSMPSQ